MSTYLINLYDFIYLLLTDFGPLSLHPPLLASLSLLSFDDILMTCLRSSCFPKSDHSFFSHHRMSLLHVSTYVYLFSRLSTANTFLFGSITMETECDRRLEPLLHRACVRATNVERQPSSSAECWLLPQCSLCNADSAASCQNDDGPPGKDSPYIFSFARHLSALGASLRHRRLCSYDSLTAPLLRLGCQSCNTF